MKILMLGWELPPHNSGGLGVACYQLCQALAHKGAQIEFILPYTAEHKIDFMKINAAHPQDVHTVLKAGIAYDSFQYVKSSGEVTSIDIFGQSALYEQSIEKIIKLAEFDVIHAHDWLTCRAGLRAKEISGKPLIVHFHSVEADRCGQEMGGNPLVREIESISLACADRIVAVSEHTKNAIIREYGVPADKIEIIHNSFDPSGLMEITGDNAYTYLSTMKSLGYKVVSNIGRLTIQKGLSNLLEAYAKAVKYIPKSFLLVVGSGDQYFELVNLSAQLGIGQHVLFADFQRGKTYRDAYTISDLFVMPSVSEPFGLTPLESIGYGTPVLISKQSGVSEVIMNALKVDFWDVDEMANQIVCVLRDPALGKEIHNNALREYEQMSWADAADKLFSIYDQHVYGAIA